MTALLATSRVTSVVGTGGLGKTRLAYAVSRQARQPVVHLVALAGVAADADVAQEVATALGTTAYGHNTSVAVGVGQSVAQGQLVAYSGNTGHSTGPHVHFEVRINGSPVDPLGYL